MLFKRFLIQIFDFMFDCFDVCEPITTLLDIVRTKKKLSNHKFLLAIFRLLVGFFYVIAAFN